MSGTASLRAGIAVPRCQCRYTQKPSRELPLRREALPLCRVCWRVRMTANTCSIYRPVTRKHKRSPVVRCLPAQYNATLISTPDLTCVSNLAVGVPIKPAFSFHGEAWLRPLEQTCSCPVAVQVWSHDSLKSTGQQQALPHVRRLCRGAREVPTLPRKSTASPGLIRRASRRKVTVSRVRFPRHRAKDRMALSSVRPETTWRGRGTHHFRL